MPATINRNRCGLLMDVSGGPDISAALVAKEIELACKFDGARVGASLANTDAAALRPSGSIPTDPLVWTGHDRRTTALVTAQRRKLYLHGTDAPNHASWRTYFSEAAWNEIYRPPVSTWAQWIADHQAAIARDKSAYVAAGLDPAFYLLVQGGNESGKGGAGGCHTTDTSTFAAPYSALIDGTWEQASDIGGSGRNVHAMYEYMAANASKQGLIWIAPSLEASWGSDITGELASIGNGSWHSWFDAWSFHRYDTSPASYLSGNMKKWLDWKWDRTMAIYSGIVGVIPAWATKPCYLTETGITLDQMLFSGTNTLRTCGFAMLGDYQRAWYERCMESGLFAAVSTYTARERVVAAAAGARYGYLANDGATVHASWSRVCGMVGDPGTSLPGGATYEFASGETATVPTV